MAIDRRRRLALLWSYLPDWLLTIVLTALFYLLDFTQGFKREFDLTDTSIQHTFAVHERVPNWMLLVIAFGAPFVIIPLINLATIRSWWDLHVGWLGMVLSLALTGSITQVVKILVGRPRPDLIDRCQPITGSANAPVYGLVTSAICTQTDAAILADGFKSFPSGHSSLSFAGLGFLSFYLAGKLHLFDQRGHTGKAWLSVGPLLGAAVVAITRTMDYRHHWQDVLTGSTLGLVISFFSYRQYYPPLSHEKSHKPFSPRIPREHHIIGDPEQQIADADPASLLPSPPHPHHYVRTREVHGSPRRAEEIEMENTISRVAGVSFDSARRGIGSESSSFDIDRKGRLPSE